MTGLNKSIAHFELPRRMTYLPISDEGFPVPWFVGYRDGKPDFRTFDGDKLAPAIKRKLCWQCGQPLGKHLSFAIGPMCAVSRSIAEPPSHLACLEYAVKACPHLSNPRAKRNEKNMQEDRFVAGVGLKRNPGVTVLWTTRSYEPWRPPGGGVLFTIGEPEHVEYYAEGRKATREEIIASMESGLPLLLEHAPSPDDIADLMRCFAREVAAVNRRYGVEIVVEA